MQQDDVDDRNDMSKFGGRDGSAPQFMLFVRLSVRKSSALSQHRRYVYSALGQYIFLDWAKAEW